MVVASFLRLVTNPKIFIQPTPVDDAIRFVDALVGVAGVEMPSLGAEWPFFADSAWRKSLRPTTFRTHGLQRQVIHLGEHLRSMPISRNYSSERN